MDGICVCGLPESLVLGLGTRRSPEASWYLAGVVPGISRDAMRQSVQEAFDRWSAVAGCLGRETSNQQDADMVITPANLDGPMGVLADCELPGPRVQRMRLDRGERWVIHPGPSVPTNRIDLVRVLSHELGHFWGVGHIQDGNLMAPTYSTRIEFPQAGDVREIQGRYGPPPSSPVPDPTQPDNPDEPSLMVIIGASGRETARFQLTRVG